MTPIQIVEAPEPVSGKKLLLAIGTAVLAAGSINIASYYALRAAFGGVSALVLQIVTLMVYLTLIVTLCAFFRPATASPMSLRFTGAKHILAAIGVLIATVAAIILVYYCLGSIFGSIPSVFRQIVSLATDAKRLQNQPTIIWSVAIFRACLIVPIFEEIFFRGLLLSWLKRHLAEEHAVIAMAALFTLEHGSFSVAPYVFLFAIATGYVRLRTDSTLNTLVMHSLNNIMLLCVGLRILNA